MIYAYRTVPCTWYVAREITHPVLIGPLEARFDRDGDFFFCQKCYLGMKHVFLIRMYIPLLLLLSMMMMMFLHPVSICRSHYACVQGRKMHLFKNKRPVYRAGRKDGASTPNLIELAADVFSTNSVRKVFLNV